MRPQPTRHLHDCMQKPAVRGPVRRLAIVLGDKLDPDADAIKGLDTSRDAILMMEVSEESTHVPTHKQRTVLFLSAMRHFARDLARSGYRVRYVRLEDPDNTHSFTGEIDRAVHELKPERILCMHPGEWRVKNLIEDATKAARVPLETRPDRHFWVDLEDFDAWMAGRKQPIMEHFYREQRRRLGVLMHESGRPIGGDWNFDEENRRAFKRAPKVPKPYSSRPDAITRAVIQLVEERFPDNPGSLESFRWPVTRTQACRALDGFVENRLAEFGTYQDAMWADEPFLYHSLLSASLNLKLLERHFMQHLVDGDFTSNNGGWQWSASTGTDAAPYFRIFNPFNQSRRYDPDGEYIRRFVPELADAPTAAFHNSNGIKSLGSQYSGLSLDRAASRARVLNAFKNLRRQQRLERANGLLSGGGAL